MNLKKLYIGMTAPCTVKILEGQPRAERRQIDNVTKTERKRERGGGGGGHFIFSVAKSNNNDKRRKDRRPAIVRRNTSSDRLTLVSASPGVVEPRTLSL